MAVKVLAEKFINNNYTKSFAQKGVKNSKSILSCTRSGNLNGYGEELTHHLSGRRFSAYTNPAMGGAAPQALELTKNGAHAIPMEEYMRIRDARLIMEEPMSISGTSEAASLYRGVITDTFDGTQYYRAMGEGLPLYNNGKEHGSISDRLWQKILNLFNS